MKKILCWLWLLPAVLAVVPVWSDEPAAAPAVPKHVKKAKKARKMGYFVDPVVTSTPLPLDEKGGDPLFHLVTRAPLGDGSRLNHIHDLIWAGESLWAATEGGVLFYNPKTDNWYVAQDPKDHLFTVCRQFALGGGYLWVATDHGLFRLGLKVHTCARFGGAQGLPTDDVRHVTADDHQVFVSYGEDADHLSHITQLSLEGKVVRDWTVPADKNHRNQYNDCCELPQGSPSPLARLLRLPLDLLTPAAAYANMDFQSEVTPGTEKHPVSSFQWRDNHVLQIFADGDSLWIVQAGSIRRLDTATQEFQTWTLEELTGQRSVEPLSDFGWGWGKTVEIVRAQDGIVVATRKKWFQYKDKAWTAYPQKVEGTPFPTPVQNWKRAKKAVKKGKYSHPEKNWVTIPPKLVAPFGTGDDLVWVGASYDVQYSSRFVLRYLKDFSSDWKDVELDLSKNGAWRTINLTCVMPVGKRVWMGSDDGVYAYTLGKKPRHYWAVLSGEGAAVRLEVQEETLEGMPPTPTPQP